MLNISLILLSTLEVGSITNIHVIDILKKKKKNLGLKKLSNLHMVTQVTNKART